MSDITSSTTVAATFEGITIVINAKNLILIHFKLNYHYHQSLSRRLLVWYGVHNHQIIMITMMMIITICSPHHHHHHHDYIILITME